MTLQEAETIKKNVDLLCKLLDDAESRKDWKKVADIQTKLLYEIEKFDSNEIKLTTEHITQ